MNNFMTKEITNKDIELFDKLLKHKSECTENVCVWKMMNQDAEKPLVISLFKKNKKSGQLINIISAQTMHGYYELHNIIDYIVFEPDEIIFISKDKDFLSCLIVGSNGSCSLFSNINRSILTTDFSKLPTSEILQTGQAMPAKLVNILTSATLGMITLLPLSKLTNVLMVPQKVQASQL